VRGAIGKGRRSIFGIIQQIPQPRLQLDLQASQPASIHETQFNQVAKVRAVLVAKRRQLHPHERRAN